MDIPIRRYHKSRFAIHWLCFLIFVALPFSNLMRMDIPKQRFYFAGQELWINEFAILFFTLMFLLFAVAAVSMIYGRLYCAYACPQMIFSEASLRVEDRIRRFINKHFIQWSAKTRTFFSRLSFYALVAVASVFLAFVFISYFVEPRDLIRRLLSFDVHTAAGVAGAATTILTFFDFAFLRERFCTTVCPYGYLQGMLADKQTLLVVYRDGEGKDKACIECKKCVRVCHMGIDIRKSPFQIECIHCGECVEACDEVLGRLHKPGLIHYTWGEQGALLGQAGGGGGVRALMNRIGLRDAKRVVVLLVLLFYASGLTVALSMRNPVMVTIMPDRATMYTLTGQGEVVNRFRMTLANRSGEDTAVTISLEGLEGRVVLPANPVMVKARESQQTSFEVIAPAQKFNTDVNHFRFVANTAPQKTSDRFEMTFIAPVRKPR
ncbi:MAG: 4Fe-4S dicluster domain-containing protein [Bryobacteraceae bacterium]|nr:4Fe-4S dicluster domain-containing protein [Bryobacteraceae bacterium]